MWFRYKAKKADGSTQIGYLSATSAVDAQKQLRDKFVALLELRPEEPGEDKTNKPFKVAPEVLTGFFRRLSTMLAAGMPLSQSLDYLAESESDRQLSAALQEIHKNVNSGQMLSVAMTMPRVQNLFSRVMIGLVQLGERTGALVDSLVRIAELCESQLRMRRAVTSALTYPAFLFLAIIGMGLFFTLILAPGDSSLFSGLGGELPWPTRVMVALSEKIRNPLWVGGTLGGLVLGFLFLRYRLRHDAALRRRLHARSLRIPVIGPLIIKTLSAQMLYVIACSLQVGMATTEALKLAREVCTNLEFRERFDRALTDFRDGTDLAEALELHEVFPHLVLTMMAMGLEVGNLELVLAKISVMYEEDVNNSLQAATQLAEPLLLAFAGAMSAFLALATLLPIINVVNTL